MAVLPLLRTKISRPPSRPNVIHRPHLLHTLGQVGEGQVTLVSAPAGFGKTTLVADCLHQSSSKNWCWLSLDQSDNDLACFWRYFVAALQTLYPGMGQVSEPSLAGLQPGNPEIEHFLTPLINEIADVTSSPSALTLVLDDYHLIHTNTIHHSLGFLLQHQPPHFHLIILTRADPPLSLARLRVQGRLHEIRAADLCFSRAEIDAFLNDVMGLELPDWALATLAERTEGWAAALQLAALSLKGLTESEAAQFVQSFAGTNEHVLAYLVEEVLQRQPPPIQQFLLRTAVLQCFTAPLSQAVTGQPDAPEILTHLAHENLFLTPLDSTGQWYRYHPLFAEALQSCLRQTEPALLPDLHRRASGWCVHNGFGDRAISHALAAQDYAVAAQLIEQAAERTWGRGALTTLLTWLDALPAALVEQRPRLCLTAAWLLFLNDRWDEAARQWEVAATLLTDLSEPEQSHLRGIWAAVGGAMAAHQRNPTRTLALSEEALILLPPDDATWREVAIINSGLGQLWHGRACQAIPALQEAADLSRHQGNTFLAFAALWHLAEAYLVAGSLYEAETVYESLRRLAQYDGGRQLHLAASADVGQAGLAYERNNLEAAESLLTNALPHLWPAGQPRVVLYGRVTLARVYQAKGNTAAAQQQLQLAEEMVQHLQMTAESRLLSAARMSLLLADGEGATGAETTAAITYWQSANALSAADRPAFRRETEYIVLLRWLLRQRRYQPAQALLDCLKTAAEADGREGSLLELLVQEALLGQAQGKIDQALASLARALSLAQRENYVRVFVDAGKEMAGLLHEAARRGIDPAFVTYLLSAFTLKYPGAPAGSRFVERLTGRELEILGLIARGCSNRQIAGKLFLSVGTVKGHVNHILSKLDAKNRTEAVAQGRALGFLDR